MDFDKAYKLALQLLETELPDFLDYHNVSHTVNVVTQTESIAINEGVDEESLLLLKTAAAFHDTGFTKEYFNNEPIGAEIAAEYLPQFNYTKKQIDSIKDIILSTAFPHNPTTYLDKIICDGDLSYVGKPNFKEIAYGLKSEFYHTKVIKSELEWLKLQVSFLGKHKFHTYSASKVGEKQFKINLLEAINDYDVYEKTLPIIE